MSEREQLLELYDAQLRAHVPRRLPPEVLVERDGPLVRTLGWGPQGWVEYRDLGEPSVEELDRLIAAQIARFGERDEPFEWKFHSHDRPAFLEERLRAAGFEAEALETVVIVRTDSLLSDDAIRPGVGLREVRERGDLELISDLESAVWGVEERWHADALGEELAANPDGLAIFVAEADGLVVSAGWVRFPDGTDFATFWGGGTLAEWRGRGVYRALVHRRARLAAERGRRYIEVDASDDSRPILERLGFQAVTQTRPYVWSP